MIGTLTYYYFFWHYSDGIRNLISVLGNILGFIINFFSIPLLFRTLLAPWKRMDETENISILNHPGEYFSQVLVNIMMRFMGSVIRASIIVLGLVTYALTLIISAVILIVWLFMPVFLILLMIAGFHLLVWGSNVSS